MREVELRRRARSDATCCDLKKENQGTRLVACRIPVGWADFAVFICELERLDEAESFVDRSSNGKIVDRDLTEANLDLRNHFQSCFSSSCLLILLCVHLTSDSIL